MATGLTTPPEVDLRSVLRRHPSGVAALTWATADGPVGVTISTFVSLSLNPALVGFAMSRTSQTWHSTRSIGVVGIQLLGAGQAELARQFAKQGVDRLAGIHLRIGPENVPIVDGCTAWLVATVQNVIETGDHDLVVCEVLHGGTGSDDDGLIHIDGELRSSRAEPGPGTTRWEI